MWLLPFSLSTSIPSSLGHLIKLPLLPITAQPSLLLPLFGLKTPYTIHPLHCLPPLLSSDYKKEHASCCPLFEQRLHNQKLRSKGHALGGSEIDKITTKEKMKRKMVLSSSLNWNTSKMKNLN